MELLMAVLMELRINGRIVARCTDVCFEAKNPRCKCICGGNNHGKGYNAAVENTLREADEWLARWREEHGGMDPEVEVTNGQMALFEIERSRK